MIKNQQLRHLIMFLRLENMKLMYYYLNFSKKYKSHKVKKKLKKQKKMKIKNPYQT